MDMNMEMEGGNIFDDIRSGFNRTFNPKLGRKIKMLQQTPLGV
jgi:hypothetical protein